MNRNITKICARLHPPSPPSLSSPLPPPHTHANSLSHHVQISALWLAGTPPPAPPLIYSSCQLSNASDSAEHVHTHTQKNTRTHTHTYKQQPCTGRQIVPLLPICQKWKVTAWWEEEQKHPPCHHLDQSWSCHVLECRVSGNRPSCHLWCAPRISDRVYG